MAQGETDGPFTRRGYRRLLETIAGAGYRFIAFDDPELQTVERACLLRHDIDIDTGAALEIARIEAELGVRSTYFMMLRSPFYNLFSRADQDFVREILDLDHHLGLHFDGGYPLRDGQRAEELVYREARVLADMFEAPVPAVSFDHPLHGLDPGGLELEGIVSAWNLPGYEYLADSNKNERMHGAPEFFAEGRAPRVQLVIHPVWWVTDEDVPQAEHFDRAWTRNFERAQEQVIGLEPDYGPPRKLRLER